MKLRTQNFGLFLVALLLSAICSLPIAGYAQTTNLVLSLDGQTGYVTVPSAANLQNPTEITVEGWICPVENGVQTTEFISKSDGGDGSSQRTYEVRWPRSPERQLWFTVFLGNAESSQSTYGVVVAHNVQSNIWIHFAGTYESSTGLLQLYTNGVLAASTNGSAGGGVPFNGLLNGLEIRQTSLPLVFGDLPSQSSTFAGGYMDELRIWNRALSAGEVAEDYACPLTGDPGLVAYWSFDNGTANDLTGNGHNGTLIGGASIVPITGPDVIHAGCFLPHSATALAQVVNGFVVGANIVNGGGGYTNNPTVTISGGGGSGATATAIEVNGVVISITIVSTGSGYTNNPIFTIAAPPYPPIQATGTAITTNGFVTGVTITSPGFGYGTNAPNVYFLDGGGVGATGIATVSNSVVTGITVTSTGSGYTNAPTVLIAAPPGLPSVGISVYSVSVNMTLIPGYHYQLQTTTDFQTWTDVGSPFLATTNFMTQVFPVGTNSTFYRLQQTP